MLTIIVRDKTYRSGALFESHRAPELIFWIAISEVCLCALVSFLLSRLVGSPVIFSSIFSGVEDIAARRVLLLLYDGVHKAVQSMQFLDFIRLYCQSYE